MCVALVGLFPQEITIVDRNDLFGIETQANKVSAFVDQLGHVGHSSFQKVNFRRPLPRAFQEPQKCGAGPSQHFSFLRCHANIARMKTLSDGALVSVFPCLMGPFPLL